MSKPTNITELRDQLLEAFDQLKGDPRRAMQAKELTNTAGKVIATLKTQIEYSMMRGEEPDIPFMGVVHAKPLKASAARLIEKP